MALSKEIRLDVYSHNVKVTHSTQRGREALFEFCRPLTQMGLKYVGYNKFVREMVRVYAAATADRSEFRFHRNQLEELVHHLKDYNYKEEQIEVIEHPLYDPVKVDFKMNPKFTSRDYQIPIIDYLSGEGETKALTLQTGRGKTYCALAATVNLGVRTLLIIKGMYVEKWMSDVKDAFGLKPGELMVVRGSKDLKTLIELGKAGELDAKFIICTNKTLYMYLKAYEKFKDGIKGIGWGCLPEDFYETIGVGLRIIDETHQEFHNNFRQDLYTHVHKTVVLSATLISDEPFMNRMYEIAYPESIRYKGAMYDKYISVKALMYGAEDIRKLRYMGKRRNYSHIVFEQSLMNKPPILKKYLELIEEAITVSYIRKCEPGQRMLIFCASVDMCTLLTEHLKKKYTDIVVNRYVSEDDYENLLTADISVSTMKSSGTAVDIPGLRTCLATDAVSSRQANEQALGRLRRLKDWPDVTPEYLYFVCKDIPQHIRYHDRKVQFFADKVLSHKTYELGMKI